MEDKGSKVEKRLLRGLNIKQFKFFQFLLIFNLFLPNLDITVKLRKSNDRNLRTANDANDNIYVVGVAEEYVGVAEGLRFEALRQRPPS